MFGEQKAKNYSEIRENNVAKKSNDVKTNTWSVESLSWHKMSRACWRKRTNVWSIMGRLKIYHLTLFCPNFCLLLRCFQEIALTYFTKLWSPADESSSFCEVLVNWASLRKKPAASLLSWHSDRDIYYTKIRFTTRNRKYGSSRNVSKSRKYFQFHWRFEPSTRMVWTIQGFQCPLKFWAKVKWKFKLMIRLSAIYSNQSLKWWIICKHY